MSMSLPQEGFIFLIFKPRPPLLVQQRGQYCSFGDHDTEPHKLACRFVADDLQDHFLGAKLAREANVVHLICIYQVSLVECLIRYFSWHVFSSAAVAFMTIFWV